jgi:hypothetical protein
MWYYFKDDNPLKLRGLGMKKFVWAILLIFAVFYVPYGMKYGWLMPLWYFPAVLLVVAIGMVIGASGPRR